MLECLLFITHAKVPSLDVPLSSNSNQVLLNAGYDPNYMLHPWVRRSYDDERKSALFFAVSNNDMPSAKLLLEAGAMTNQDPVKCLQVQMRAQVLISGVGWGACALHMVFSQIKTSKKQQNTSVCLCHVVSLH